MPKKSVFIAGIAAVVIGGLMYWILSGGETPSESLASTPDTSIQNKSTDTIADKWQWNNFANTKQADEDSEGGGSRPTSAVPEGVVGIYRILQSIKLDENGRVLPDQTLKEALEMGFDDLGPNLSAAAMSELQNLIRKGLPGPAGEEAAYILGNYYQFRLAEVAFNQPMATPTSAVNRHEELVQLRRNFLGEEIADKLFAMEDNQARHMFAAIAIQQNTDLTAEQKETQTAALQEKLNDRLLAQGQLEPTEAAAEKVRRLNEQGAPNVDIAADVYSTRKSILGTESARELAAADREEAQWQRRFNGFWQARHYVMQAGLEEAERERQTEQLLDQYFTAEERERARVTSSDWQARDTK